MTEKKKIKLGDRVRDVYTGFEGTAVCRTEWLHGCTRIGIEPTVLKDGKLMDIVSFDEQRVEVVREESPRVTPEGSSAAPGGPQKDPARPADPI